MRFAYADPPYPGQASKYQREAKANGRKASEVDHAELIDRLVHDYADGWALSTSSSGLKMVLALCPAKVRVCAWVKPFVPAYKGIRPVYSWEPVILCGGRKPSGVDDPLTRDSLFMSPRMGMRPRQTTAPLGAKSREFCRWILDLLNFQPGDDLDDIFPGSGVMGSVVRNYQGALAFPSADSASSDRASSA